MPASPSHPVDFNTGMEINKMSKTINPPTGATLTAVATNDFFGAFAIRADGTIFGGTGDAHKLFTINPLTGFETLVGHTGSTFVGDLAFAPVPESGSSFALLLLGVIALVGIKSVSLRRPKGQQ